MVQATEEKMTSFDHMNLNEVDPTSAKVPDGDYNFVIASAQQKTYSNENGSGTYITVRFAITQNPNYTGRSFYSSLFPSQGNAKKLRTLMDAVGEPQAQGQEVIDWLQGLVQSGASFNAAVQTVDEMDKRLSPPAPRKVQRVNLFSASPAV